MGRVRVEEEGEEGVGARGRVEEARDVVSGFGNWGDRAGDIVSGCQTCEGSSRAEFVAWRGGLYCMAEGYVIVRGAKFGHSPVIAAITLVVEVSRSRRQIPRYNVPRRQRKLASSFEFFFATLGTCHPAFTS